MELKKNKLLQICGILMIIGGSLQIILSLIVILGLIVLLAIAESGTFLLFISALLIIVSAVVSFIAGIVGTKNAANPAKADKCIFYGFFCIALSLLEKIPPVSMYLSCSLLHTGNYEGLDSRVRERKLQCATMSFQFPVCYARGRTGTNCSSLK
jgi:hypothetical protein